MERNSSSAAASSTQSSINIGVFVGLAITVLSFVLLVIALGTYYSRQRKRSSSNGIICGSGTDVPSGTREMSERRTSSQLSRRKDTRGDRRLCYPFFMSSPTQPVRAPSPSKLSPLLQSPLNVDETSARMTQLGSPYCLPNLPRLSMPSISQAVSEAYCTTRMLELQDREPDKNSYNISQMKHASRIQPLRNSGEKRESCSPQRPRWSRWFGGDSRGNSSSASTPSASPQRINLLETAHKTHSTLSLSNFPTPPVHAFTADVAVQPMIPISLALPVKAKVPMYRTFNSRFSHLKGGISTDEMSRRASNRCTVLHCTPLRSTESP